LSLGLLRRDYEATLNELASAVGLDYEELARFCGDIENGSYGALKLKEFFKAPEIIDMLDRLAELSDQYRKKALPAKTC